MTANLVTGIGFHGTELLTLGGFESVTGTDFDDTITAAGNTTDTELLNGRFGADTFIVDNASSDYSNLFLQGAAGINRLVVAGNSGDVFDLTGTDVAFIDEIEFAFGSGTGTLTASLDADEIGGNDLPDNLLVYGFSAGGRTEVIRIDLGTSTTMDDIDLSGWSFTGWGDQG